MALQPEGSHYSNSYDNGLDLHNDDISDDNDGWGVDSDMYTTKLNTGQLTEEQIQMAIQLEKEILNESRSNRFGYEYTEEEQYYDNNSSTSASVPSNYDEPARLPNSAEEALQMLAQRKQQVSNVAPIGVKEQRRPVRPAATARPKRQYGTADDEIRAYRELCKQYRGVQVRQSIPLPLLRDIFVTQLFVFAVTLVKTCKVW